MTKPVSPLGGWKGGKFRLAKQIVAMFPPHVCYCEPFCGAAHVFFRKDRAPVEVLNDINFDIINFFEVCRDRSDELLARFRYVVASRKLFETYRDEPAPKDPVERAFRFVYILKLCFGGRMTGKSSYDQSKKDSISPTALDKTPQRIAGDGAAYGATKSKNHPPKICSAPQALAGKAAAYQTWKQNRPGYGFEEASFGGARARLAEVCDSIHGRFRRVSLECGPWQKMFDRYDGEGTLFYLDPPYEGAPCYPGENLFVAERDLPELADRLKKIKGKFALSINDGEAARALFAGYNFRELVGQYSSHNLKTKARVQKRELLITNYEPPQGELNGSEHE